MHQVTSHPEYLKCGKTVCPADPVGGKLSALPRPRIAGELQVCAGVAGARSAAVSQEQTRPTAGCLGRML